MIAVKHLRGRLEGPAAVQAFLFWLDDGLKGNSEFSVLGFEGDFFNFGFSYIAGKRTFYFPDTIIYVCSRALGKHLNGAVRAVADKAG